MMMDPDNAKKNPLILIADDDQLVRVTFQDALNGDGFLTATATDGTSAISSFMTLQPDLVVLDLFMPGKDGITVCQEIRSLPEGKYIPILMVTGMNDTDLIHRAFEAGATDFVIKPVKLESWFTGCATCCGPVGTLKSLRKVKSDWPLLSVSSIWGTGN